MTTLSRRQLLVLCSSLCLPFVAAKSALALDLSNLSIGEANAGLKEALQRASDIAVQQLGQEGGFLNRADIRIPLPDVLAKSKRALSLIGMGDTLNQLETSMNHAAERAIPEAKALLNQAVRSMTVDDAKTILAGGDDAVTQFFRQKTSADLLTRFIPIVKQTTDQVGLAKQYNEFVGKAGQMGVLKGNAGNIENHVAEKALDGLFRVIAEQEKAIRANPVGTGSQLLKKIFGGQ